MQRQTIRSQLKTERAALTPALWQAKSEAIFAHMIKSEAYRAAPRVFTYISIQNEVDTRALLAQSWADGKTVVVPVCAAGGGMDFVAITPQTPLCKTKQGTLEPALDMAAVLRPAADDLFLVPGLVFDAGGGRYGYGGGFYDRYLAANSAAVPTALCFGFQISETPLETAPHDVPMAQLVTEDGWRACNPKQ